MEKRQTEHTDEVVMRAQCTFSLRWVEAVFVWGLLGFVALVGAAFLFGSGSSCGLC